MAHQNFINWMKAFGMFLIVIGHIFGGSQQIFNLVSQPIYTKQLGVCFFIFIMGWSLANEHRPGTAVVFKRLFPVYFYGLLFTLLLSAFFFLIGHDINESNYLPFFLGVNVFFNNFPANPTTWYIGTYFHLLLFWLFFLQGKEIKGTHLLLAFVSEIVIRSFLIWSGKDFIAYMLLPNWLSVFLLGAYLHNKKDCQWRVKNVAIVMIWLVIVFWWVSSSNIITFGKGFPFRSLVFNEFWELPIRSFLVSMLYIISTVVAFSLFRMLRHSKIINFFARNSLLTFIAHMPIIFGIHADFYRLFNSDFHGRLALIIMIYVGLAVISEYIQKKIPLANLSNRSWRKITQYLPVETDTHSRTTKHKDT